jgi:hypothetical protein
MSERQSDLIRDRFLRPGEMLDPTRAIAMAWSFTSEFIKRMAGMTR